MSGQVSSRSETGFCWHACEENQCHQKINAISVCHRVCTHLRGRVSRSSTRRGTPFKPTLANPVCDARENLSNVWVCKSIHQHVCSREIVQAAQSCACLSRLYSCMGCSNAYHLKSPFASSLESASSMNKRTINAAKCGLSVVSESNFFNAFDSFAAIGTAIDR